MHDCGYNPYKWGYNPIFFLQLYSRAHFVHQVGSFPAILLPSNRHHDLQVHVCVDGAQVCLVAAKFWCSPFFSQQKSQVWWLN